MFVSASVFVFVFLMSFLEWLYFWKVCLTWSEDINGEILLNYWKTCWLLSKTSDSESFSTFLKKISSLLREKILKFRNYPHLLCVEKKDWCQPHFGLFSKMQFLNWVKNVYLLLRYVPLIAKGAVRILHWPINHMTNQQIYFSGWTRFLHTCLGLICDIWTNYL